MNVLYKLKKSYEQIHQLNTLLIKDLQNPLEEVKNKHVKVKMKQQNLKKEFNLTEHIRDQLVHDSTGKCTNAFTIINKPETLKYAYESIKSKPGNMVRGSDFATLDGINLE